MCVVKIKLHVSRYEFGGCGHFCHVWVCVMRTWNFLGCKFTGHGLSIRWDFGCPHP